MQHPPAHATRERILAAAEALSCEVGPARISIEAVASRAGVSKGGLLYHFPNKHLLLRALIADHVAATRRAMEALAPAGSGPIHVARAYLQVTRDKLSASKAPPGIFAAIAEDPEFVAPLRAFREEMRLQVFGRCPDPKRAQVVFLAAEGLVHSMLTDPQAYDPVASEGAFETLEAMLGEPA